MNAPGAHLSASGVAVFASTSKPNNAQRLAFALLIALVLIGPFFIYPIFMMRMLCFAMFACAFNLLIGYTGLLS
jgi:ABC-type branched-subunit amino acid transport system permease subunit